MPVVSFKSGIAVSKYLFVKNSHSVFLHSFLNSIFSVGGSGACIKRVYKID